MIPLASLQKINEKDSFAVFVFPTVQHFESR